MLKQGKPEIATGQQYRVAGKYPLNDSGNPLLAVGRAKGAERVGNRDCVFLSHADSRERPAPNMKGEMTFDSVSSVPPATGVLGPGGHVAARPPFPVEMDGNGKIERFSQLIDDPQLIARISTRVAEGESLKDLAKAWGVPYGMLARWIADDDSRRAQYEIGLALYADAEAMECIRIADGATLEDVAVSRLQIETRIKLIAKWDKQRYGAQADTGASGFSGGINIVIEGVQSKFGPKAIEGEVVG